MADVNLSPVSMKNNITYQTRLKAHLSEYKRVCLNVTADGEWRRNSYSHILPVDLRSLNIIEAFRSEFWQFYQEDNRRKLHPGFHHLNSSQAMGFNLLYPLIHNGTLGTAFGVPDDSLVSTRSRRLLTDPRQPISISI